MHWRCCQNMLSSKIGAYLQLGRQGNEGGGDGVRSALEHADEQRKAARPRRVRVRAALYVCGAHIALRVVLAQAI